MSFTSRFSGLTTPTKIQVLCGTLLVVLLGSHLSARTVLLAGDSWLSFFIMIGAFTLAALLMFIVVRLTAAPLERVGAGATPPAMGAPEVATLTPKHELGAKACSPAAMRETGVRSVRVKTALDHASSSVMIVDGEHRIVYANAALHSLFGALADEPSAASDRLPATAVVGRDFDEFHDHDSLRPAALDALEQELVARMTLGAHTLDLVVNPVVNDAGERLGTIVEWLDMSQLVAVEARVATLVADRTARARQQSLELEKALIRERELNLMQRQFVTMVSHEFRTPLSVIDGAAQLLMRRLDRLEPAEIAKRVGRIRGAVLRMTGLIDTTLTAASLSSGKLEVSPEAFDPRAVIRCCCQRQAEIAQQHRITADLEQLPSEAIADPRLVE